MNKPESDQSPARVAEVPIAKAQGFTIRGPQAHQIAAALDDAAAEQKDIHSTELRK